MGEEPSTSLNLASPSAVKAWCIAHGFHPNRTLGQNFLIDRNALEAIASAACAADVAPPADARCLEVGPGLGALTETLLRRGWSVTAVEKDPVLAARLYAALGNPAALTVTEGDAVDFVKEGRADGIPTMVSNLPYQAGTRILLELVRRADLGLERAPAKMVVLVQTEVAERLAAGPGSKVRGLAGVWAQLDYDVSIVRHVGANCFWPRPQIGSTVVSLVRHDRNAGLGAAVRRRFRTIVKTAFEHRRKQLGTVFRGIVESTSRAEELSNGDWTALAAAWPEEEASGEPRPER